MRAKLIVFLLFCMFFANAQAPQSEFTEFSSDTTSAIVSVVSPENEGISRNIALNISLALAMTVVAGILIKSKTGRKLRSLFLAFSLIFFGFINGGCPCVIDSLQNSVLVFFTSVKWWKYILFALLLPLTYFLGRVWCGWVCHLGALQEFLFMGKLEILKSAKAQKILNVIRICVLVLLVFQLVIAKRIIIDLACPFKVAFNLFSSNITGYILLALLIISSLFVYRPFCRAVCPVGLILGLVSFLPYSRKVVFDSQCTNCGKCVKVCKGHALTKENGTVSLKNEYCFWDGDCLDSCTKMKIDK